jgi:hypothetical protein
MLSHEELQLIESLLQNFLTYDVTGDLMIEDEIKKALVAVQRELDLLDIIG